VSKKYSNPPLIEAVCEFRLTPNTPWDITIPGLLYEQLKVAFPNREQRVVQEVVYVPSPQGLQQQIQIGERIFLFSAEKRLFVQIGPRVLTLNVLKPYPNWNGFRPKIEKVWQSLMHTVEVKGVERIGLRYINKIELLKWSGKLEDYFEFYLFLGKRLPQTMASFIAAVELPYANDRDRCRVQLMDAPFDPPNQKAFFLDIDYFLTQPQAVDTAATLEWVEEAHRQAEEVFEGCINDRLRNLFGLEVE
jgi:uncharacterized protein (TIGR04255 family)